MSRKTFRMTGFKELERALSDDLPKATARNVLRRAATKSMERIRLKMGALAPRDEGDLAGSMKTQNVTAKRARGSVRFARSSGVQVMTGPAPEGKLNRSNAGWQEDGTLEMSPNPYARPAADSEGAAVVKEVREILTDEVSKAKARIARKAAKG